MREKEQHSQITPERIMQLAWDYAPPLIIEAAIYNRIFDVLDGSAKTIDQISSETGYPSPTFTFTDECSYGIRVTRKRWRLSVRFGS